MREVDNGFSAGVPTSFPFHFSHAQTHQREIQTTSATPDRRGLDETELAEFGTLRFSSLSFDLSSVAIILPELSHAFELPKTQYL